MNTKAQSQSVLVIGAPRGTGLEVVRQLQEREVPTTALVRPTSELTGLKEIGATTAIGDAMDRASLDKVMADNSFTAVIASIGRAHDAKTRDDYACYKNSIDAAKSAGVERFIMISAIGAQDSWDALAEQAQKILGVVIDMKSKAEKDLQNSGLAYTIIRPGALNSETATGKGLLSEDRSVMGTITRADLAALAVGCVFDDKTIGGIFAAVDEDLIGITPF